MIFWVPTPLAIPAQRLSTSRIMLQRSAHAWLMMVIWAPKSEGKKISENQNQNVFKDTSYVNHNYTPVFVSPYCMGTILFSTPKSVHTYKDLKAAITVLSPPDKTATQTG